ncbi:MAG: radical SAM protein [Clostridia bacterium]|nr:radical SAM protein [Clostridia bacterium]
MQKHKNIPFFIPHSGCKNNCVFCSQTKITGYCLPESDMISEAHRLRNVVEESLQYLNGGEAQIAFFGGSFTGIEPERMVLLLQTAYEYVKDGKVCGVRLSTRPDYIDDSILDILESYGVTDIELGLQSTDEAVLKAAGRGHDRDVCFRSAEQIVKRGFRLGGQMMIGLPESNLAKEVRTAKDIVDMGAVCARIYPTVVFEGTKLYDMAMEGSYTPLTNDEAVIRSVECLSVFRKSNVEILRIGLHASDELARAPFGANHPAMGELVYGEEAYRNIASHIGQRDTYDKTLKVYVPPRLVSACAGVNGRNKERLIANYGFKAVKIYKNEDVSELKVIIEAEE